jgi:CRISPR-associated endonuclease Csn1
MGGYTLGLDLGPNSIGWAIIDEEAQRIVNVGVRVFPEGVDKFDTAKEVSRNEGRRLARGMRRQTERRKRRKRQLCQALVEAGLLPSDAVEQELLFKLDPYELRSRALSERLSPSELGRVFYHLGQRRGFQSNRKKDRGDKEVKGILAEINDLAAEIKREEVLTLGQLLHRKATAFDHANRRENDELRGPHRHTDRKMFLEEFEAIWAAQHRLGNSHLLTEALKFGECGERKYPLRPRRRSQGQSLLQAYGLHGLIFFQRKMYWPRSAVGTCELEPKQPRCQRADRRAQRFRLLQEVNNLRYVAPEARGEQRLNEEQRRLLLGKMGEREKMTFDEIRNALGFLDSVKFNLEKGKRSYLSGMTVDSRMAKAVGKSWYERPEAEKDAIVHMLIDNEREDDLVIQRLVDCHQMTEAQAVEASRADFPAGYVNLSLVAIKKLLPHLESGLVYQSTSDPRESALHAAGYLRRDELQRRLFDLLPAPGRIRDCPIGDLPNPVVKRTLVELRKMVNAIVTAYGKPAAVHVEMGRDVKTRPAKETESYRKYQEQLDDMRQREARRSAAVDELRRYGVTINRDNITRYLLWQDQDGICIYSGRPISVAQLFGAGEVHIDHVLPYSRCLDDSQANKVVCFRTANADKGNRSPAEWLADAHPQRYEEVCQRAASLMRQGQFPYAKYRRFLQKELDLDTFIERQLNDTRYIARLTAEYLRCLFEAPHHVLGVKGQLTAELRHHWGIDTLLAELPDSPAWQEQDDLRPGEKNRADHRHHAIDAVIIALTNRRRLQELSQIHREGGTSVTGRVALDPWHGFREDLLRAVRDIRVSHRAEKKVSGKLHEDTLYGPTEEEGVWVSRKAVASLSPNEIESVRDKGIQRIIITWLKELGVEYGRGKKVDVGVWKRAMADLKMPSGVPVRKVRVTKPELTICAVNEGDPSARFVKPGSIHHLCIFEVSQRGKAKREPEFVSMLDAVQRLRRKEPVIQRTSSKRPNAKFIMSLSRGELVLAEWQGSEKLLVFTTAASTQGQLYFVEHTDARRSTEAKKYVATANSLQARKVTVDRLGRLRWAND